MLYTEYNKLTTVNLMNEADRVSFNELSVILKERPANVIYCELDGKLYGIISMGDVARADEEGKKAVCINKRFTSVKPGEYMKVRQIFHEKEKINAVPVIDENGRLSGDYTRWDDLLVLEHLNLFDEQSHLAEFLREGRGENNHIALVKPNVSFEKKQRLMEKWRSELDQIGIRAEVIDRTSVPEYIDKVDLVLFTDEDEWRGSITLIENICHKELSWGKYYTYKGIWEKTRQYIEDKTLDKCIEYIRKKGVHILALQFKDNGSEYYHRLVGKDIPQKFIDEDVLPSNQLPSSAMEGFFEELYTEEYANAVVRHQFKIEKFNGANRLGDISGKYQNVEDGERLTVGSPIKYDRTIYFFGPCFIIGALVEDKHTIESFLQVKCNSEGNSCRVVNLGCCDYPAGTVQRILSTPIRENDIIVMNLLNNKEISCVDNLNLTNALEENDAPAKWFVEELRHCNHKANEIYADAIYEAIRQVLEMPVHSGDLIDMGNQTAFDIYFNCYFNDFNHNLYGRIGSIVMNCNPFTNGHRYLIEEALKYVDFLIIFVVEEDGSVFTFEERFGLVNAGVSDLQNVMVVPSGQFILSQQTFPEYFLKVEDEELIKNVEYDITLFAEQIAPRLNITYRFVGEEPQDAVTNEYNQAMKRILPQKGINFIEIPRIENDNGIISASLVRKYLEDGNRTELRELIPESTWEILFG